MKYLAVILFFIAAFSVQAGYVQGTVIDETGTQLSGVNILLKGTTIQTMTDANGFYSLNVQASSGMLVFSKNGYKTQEFRYKGQKILDVVLAYKMEGDIEVVLDSEITQETIVEDIVFEEAPDIAYNGQPSRMSKMVLGSGANFTYDEPQWNTEDYATIHENGFKKVFDAPLSTFSIDVDAASYSNVRRFLNMGQLPPKDAVRIEEMINYFTYDYENPKGQHPFAINTDVTKAPWNGQHLIAQVGIQGKQIEMEDLPPSNIVFLIDVSGSMNQQNKLPLLKSAFKLLANELRPKDKVSIVVYAGAAGLVLEPTDGNETQKIMEALDKLSAGGSTAGGAGIALAYKTAKEHFVKGGNNRVVLATDGDFNVGASSNAEMERLIEEKRKEGIFLTVLGFGMGNYKDSKMEILADKGNGNYAYIDNMKEAKKVLVNEFGGTLFTIAKDVKIQVEFNPAVVQAYRLIGYENRKLNDEDFNDDTKDAGELGSGHTVTALYEIIPVGVKSGFVKGIDPLKYQENQQKVLGGNDELFTVKFRYKAPDEDNSQLISHVVKNTVGKAGENLNWAMAVAGFGMLLRDSEYLNDLGYEDVLALAKSAKGEDKFGYRGEFIELVGLASKIRSIEN